VAENFDLLNSNRSAKVGGKNTASLCEAPAEPVNPSFYAKHSPVLPWVAGAVRSRREEDDDDDDDEDGWWLTAEGLEGGLLRPRRW
jgi:hypothetical protein